MAEDRALEFLQNIRHQAENPGVIEDGSLSILWEITYYVNPAVRVVKVGPLERRNDEG